MERYETVTIQIGNSDDKLTQKEWSSFVAWIEYDLKSMIGVEFHFSGGSANHTPWDRDWETDLVCVLVLVAVCVGD